METQEKTLLRTKFVLISGNEYLLIPFNQNLLEQKLLATDTHQIQGRLLSLSDQDLPKKVSENISEYVCVEFLNYDYKGNSVFFMSIRDKVQLLNK